MKTRTLIRRSLAFYWRTHLGVVLGSALAALVLTGALMVGDSVKATLRTQAEARVGKVGEALVCGERFVPWAAAPEKKPQVVARMFYPGADAAGIVLVQGSATRSDGKARANRVQVVGVDEAFWKLAPGGVDSMDSMDSMDGVDGAKGGNSVNGVRLNSRLAAQLGAKAGDEVLIKVEKPGALSKDAPLSGEEDVVVTLRLRVARVVGDAEFGRFALTSGQVPPHTAFVPLAALQEKLGIGEKVNVILHSRLHIDLGRDSGVDRPPTAMERIGARIKSAIAIGPERKGIRVPPGGVEIPGFGFAFVKDERDEALDREDIRTPTGAGRHLPDFGFNVSELPSNSGFEIRTGRIFLDGTVVSAARANERLKVRPNIPDEDDETVAPPPPGLDSLTYFVNSLALGDGSDAKAPGTPYSFVTALDAPAGGFVQPKLADDEIQITRWLADDLGAKPGDKITMRYFVMGERRELVEKARTFTVLAPIIEMNEPQLDTSWMPDFPNIPDKDSFSKWKPGFPFDSKRIRKKDEDYWRDHRGTPKAFVNLKVGQEMWGNRWGNLTSIRYPAGTKREQVERIAAFIDPEKLGFRVVPLREQALAATDAPVDFGQLFTAFSFFLIAAAAVLTGLLFTFSIEQRAVEAGLLLAVGWTRRRVKKLFLREGTLLAIIGSAAGVALAALYTKAVLAGLAGVWSGATGGTAFIFAPTALSCGIGLLAGVIVARVAMGLASRRIYKREAAALLAGSSDWENPANGGRTPINVTPELAGNLPVVATTEGMVADKMKMVAGNPSVMADKMKLSDGEIETVPGVIETSPGEASKEGRLDTALNPGGVLNQVGTQKGMSSPESTPANPVNPLNPANPVSKSGQDFQHLKDPRLQPSGATRRRRRKMSIINFLCCADWFFWIAPLVIAFFLMNRKGNPMAFFGLGFALLAIGILFARRLLLRFSTATAMESGADLALRNTTRRRGRSLATIAVLAGGVFMVVAVDSFRKDSAADATRRDSGTGGFALVGESAAPIYEDLNSEKGREAYALDDKIMGGVRVVQMRVKDGDDASCLNLNKAVQPRVVGVKFEDLGDETVGPARFGVAWNAPFSHSPANMVLAEPPRTLCVVDANTLQWALKKRVGDSITIPAEQGGEMSAWVAMTMPASILQGVVIVNEDEFVKHFPNTAGYRFFLVDCAPEKMAEVREHLSAQLSDRGLELTPAAQRLAEFNAVENTYLSIFQVLGGLGMLLGSAGLGIVVARNVLERRREFGLLEAVGFTPRQLRALVFAEHRWLIVGALGIGAVSALVAVWPGISQKGATFPWMNLAVLFGGMAVFAAASAWIATRLALRGSQLNALRSE